MKSEMEKPIALSLTVPEPEFRPGDKPDFSNVALSSAGEVARPDIDVTLKACVIWPSRSFGFSIARVMRWVLGPAL